FDLLIRVQFRLLPRTSTHSLFSRFPVVFTIRSTRLLLIEGAVQRQEGVISLLARRIIALQKLAASALRYNQDLPFGSLAS
ncbi:MAG TPA: hypothetical protein VF177_04930, partial [Anaerolineae bacterium]